MANNAIDSYLYMKDHRRSLTREQLMQIYETAGGFAAFASVQQPYSALDYGRRGLMQAVNFPEEEYRRLFAAMDFDQYSILGQHFPAYILNDPEAFERLWKINKADVLDKIYDVATEYRPFDKFGIRWSADEPAPAIHDSCFTRGDGSISHLDCRENRSVTDTAKLRETYSEARDFALEALDEAVIERARSYAITGPLQVRAHYAASPLVHSEHWEDLASDKKRDVVNNVMENPLAPESIKAELARKHKTPAIRIGVAKTTTDLALLDWIWNSTKSKDIRDAVQQNKLWGV